MRVMLVAALLLATVALTACDDSMKVFRPEGSARVKWPLTVDSGTLRCEWKGNRPLVLFESEEGVHGVNGAASGFGGYPPLRNIMVDQRLWPLVNPVVGEWIQAGLALCDDDDDEAKKRIGMANSLAAEPLPPGVERTLSTKPESVNRRRIFFEAVRCEDIAMRTTNKEYDSQVERLVDSGRRVEAQQLTREKFEKMDERTAACKEKLRQQQELSSSEFRQIVREGLSKHWPMPK